ncbi:MAG TPA: L-lactate dehydrogenase [Atribacter sp.]|jgi:L-lactate dehydrogenase|nr:L-lactate dehydrogenase [Atribacterota bacterium]HHT09954.1 L-lactate dehydrogenase [Candidatus Atribacteria bacterium]HOT05170.1 L-lactate dehydrogenase [Atribacter sp.]
MNQNQQKISLVGVGRVGSMLALTILMKGLAKEMVLVGENNHQAQGEAYDLIHASSFAHPMKIYAGPIEATSHSDIIVVSASVPMTNMKNRLDLGTGNATLFRNLIPQLSQLSPEAIFIIITNPVDIMTYYTIRLSNFPPSRVMGTGTLIDSGRFRSLLGLYSGIHPEDIHAYILGEHGESEFPVLSLADFGGMGMENSLPVCRKTCPLKNLAEVFEEAKDGGMLVYRHKGYTNHAIALATCTLIEAIFKDSGRILPVSTLIDGYLGVTDMCLSMPVVLGQEGILKIIELNMNEQEQTAFRSSAAVLKKAAKEMGIE